MADGEFPGGIFWLNAEDPDLTTRWGTSVEDALRVHEGPVGERARVVVHRLSEGDDVLLVLDNVVEWTASEHPGPLPEGPHVTQLVTSRRRDLGHGFRSHDLDVLGAEDARRLLLELCRRDLKGDEGLDGLLEYLGGHALAVELAGAYLRELPDISPTEYLDRLTDDPTIEEEVVSQARYEKTVHQALQATWDTLDKAAQRAWLVAACFESAPATAELADACGLNADARRALRRYHLIDNAADGRWKMHRLTRAFSTRAGTEDEREDAVRAFVEGCRNRARETDHQLGFRIYLPDKAHFDSALARRFEAGLPPVEYSAFLDDIGRALLSMGDLRDAARFFHEGLTLDVENLGEDHPSVAASRSNLAVVLQDLGDPVGAKELLEQALYSALKNFGEEHPEVSTVRSNLGSVFQELGDLPRAKELHEQALDSALENLGEDHPEVSAIRSNLATVFQDLGDLPRAKELHEQALDPALKNLGEDHPDVAKRRSNLATVLQDLGDLPRAKELHAQALDSNLKNFGENHPSVATSRYNLSDVLEAEGDLAGAIEQLAEVLRAELITLGSEHPSLAQTRAKLASLLSRQGDVERVRIEATEARRIVASQSPASRHRTIVERLTADIL